MSEFDQLRVERLTEKAGAASNVRHKERAPHDLLRLQRLAGNAAVSGLFVQREDAGVQDASAAPSTSGGEPMMQMVWMSKPGGITVKLQNGQVLDASATVGDQTR